MRSLLVLVCLATGCAEIDDTEYPDEGTAELPPRGPNAMMTWIKGGAYLEWNCEPSSHPARDRSPHGPNRICTNDALSFAPDDAPLPVGAASIKELFDGSRIRGYAVMRKLETDSDGGNGWYWYEAFGDDVAVATAGASCSDCHSRASHDFAFTVVR
jgi:hypothetical protein